MLDVEHSPLFRLTVKAPLPAILVSDGPVFGLFFGRSRVVLQEPWVEKRGNMMEFDPDVADDLPWSESVTAYDERHLITYLRLLDAQDEGADWKEVARIILHRDAAADPDRTRLCWEAHLRRANWMVEHGYRRLFTGAKTGKATRDR